MMKITEEDGTEGEYPLTFICQIDCEDIAPFDKEGLLPHEGMLYFFAAIDEFIGYDSPEHFPLGRWPKKAVRFRPARPCTTALERAATQRLTFWTSPTG